MFCCSIPNAGLRTKQDRSRVRSYLEGSRSKRSRNPKAQKVAAAVGVVPKAAGGAGDLRLTDPGPPADDTATAIAPNPGGAVGTPTFVVFVVTILHPLPYIAGHVVEAERIGGKRSDRRRLQVVPFAAAPVAVGVIFADLIAPVIGCRPACACRVFPVG